MKSLLQSAARKAGEKFRENYGIPSAESPPLNLFPSSSHSAGNKSQHAHGVVESKEPEEFVSPPSPSEITSQFYTPSRQDRSETKETTQEPITFQDSPASRSIGMAGKRPTDASAWQDIVLLKSLSATEKTFVLAFFLATLYINIGNWTLQSFIQATTHMLTHTLPQAIEHNFQHSLKHIVGDVLSYVTSQDNWPVLLCGGALGVCVSVSFDYDTHATDESVANAYHTTQSVWMHIFTMLTGVYAQSSESVKHTINTIQQTIQATQRVIEQTPMVVRYLAGILTCTLVVRYVYGYVYGLVTYAIHTYWHTLIVGSISVCGIAAAIAYVQKMITHRRLRQQAVQSVVRAIYLALAYYQQSYPVDQMKDEIEHHLHHHHDQQQQQYKGTAGAPKSPFVSPLKTAIQFVGNVVNFLGSPKPATTLELPAEIVSIYSTIQGVSEGKREGLKLDEVWGEVMGVIKREKKVRVNEKDVHNVKTKCFTLN
ncbi:hypothetical protein EON65_12465 [archaeon]|nr:MAG: hypothetical protein EON65_12465 [archaeon]